MIDFFENHSYYRFVSASLFLLVDNINMKYTCKIIGYNLNLDLTHYEKLQNGEIDLNFL